MLPQRKKTKKELRAEIKENLGSFALKLSLRRTINNEQTKLRQIKETLGLLDDSKRRENCTSGSVQERRIKNSQFLLKNTKILP